MRRLLPVLLLELVLAAIAHAAGAVGPAPTRSADPPSDAVLAELPFLASDEPNRIVVDLAPDGDTPLRLLVDTGAAASVLTPRYARKLGVSVRREKGTPYRRETRLGRDLQFWVDIQSSDTASKTGWEYGLLGGTFLREYVLELDFARRRIRFLDPERYRVPKKVDAENEAVLPLQIVGNRPIVDAAIGGEAVHLLLDTGAWQTGVLSGETARTAGLEAARLSGVRAGSVWGPVDVEFAEAPSLRLGPFELTRVPLLVAPKGWYNQGSSTDSLLGYDVLAQFTVRIDYPHRRLWLRRRADVELTYAGVPYAAQRRAGLLVGSVPKGLAVLGLFPDSPATRLGILPGDVIVPVGGEDPAAFEPRPSTRSRPGERSPCRVRSTERGSTCRFPRARVTPRPTLQGASRRGS